MVTPRRCEQTGTYPALHKARVASPCRWEPAHGERPCECQERVCRPGERDTTAVRARIATRFGPASDFSSFGEPATTIQRPARTRRSRSSRGSGCAWRRRKRSMLPALSLRRNRQAWRAGEVPDPRGGDRERCTADCRSTHLRSGRHRCDGDGDAEPTTRPTARPPPRSWRRTTCWHSIRVSSALEEHRTNGALTLPPSGAPSWQPVSACSTEQPGHLAWASARLPA